jgi:hypothetical protein
MEETMRDNFFYNPHEEEHHIKIAKQSDLWKYVTKKFKKYTLDQKIRTWYELCKESGVPLAYKLFL